MSGVVNVHEMSVQVHFAVVEVYPGRVHVDPWVLLAVTVVVVAVVER